MITGELGGSIRHTEHGDPDGEPVVLLAGFKAPATSWRFQIPLLAGAGFRVLAVDLPGHGGTALPEGTDMDVRGRDLHTFLTAAVAGRARLVGASMGGNTLWSYVARFGTGAVERIVIVDQTPAMLNTPDWPHGFYGYTEENADTYFRDGIPRTGRGVPLLRRGAAAVRLLVAMRGTDPALTGPEGELLRDHARRDWRPVVAGAEVPALFVAGGRSEFWPPEHAAAAAALNPRASAAVVGRAGHAVNMERPRAFGHGLVEYLRRGTTAG
ncbi:alpha/beta fold hydrolase [Nocardiopsis flavescens]|uniref:alpha/beta fold hydrolase n=1 Tax=Nocardiopsis flavescens TaxID=758803 RepID=UPI0036694800